MNRTYLYAIIGGTDSIDEARLGIGGVGDAGPVYTLWHNGIGCVVRNFAEPMGEALSREELVQRLLAHQRVVEHVMRDHPVLPVKFGTVLGSPREVQTLLSQGRSTLLEALASVQEKVEIEVAATWDTSRVVQEVAREEEVARAREALARKSQPTVEERVQLGQMVKAAMDRRRRSYGERMMGVLKPLSVDAAANVLVSEEMVMNVAFLVERARQQEFDQGVQQLDGLFQNEIAFRMIGPLPPYSFCTVEVARIAPEQLQEARETLLLGGVVTEAEVRKAYRRLAAERQRNVSAGEDGEAKQQYARLRRASEVLVRSCRAGASTSKEGLLALDIRATKRDEVEAARFGGPGKA